MSDAAKGAKTIDFSLFRYLTTQLALAYQRLKKKNTNTIECFAKCVLTDDTCECIYVFQIIISVAKHSLTATYIRRAHI